MSRTKPVILTCAVTGSGDTTTKNPNVPVTPAEIATSVAEAAKAGAAIAHLHVRDPKTGKESFDIALFRETVDLIRAQDTDILINLTTAIGTDIDIDLDDPSKLGPDHAFFNASDRVQHVVENTPDVCSLDAANMLMHDSAYLNFPDHIRHIAAQARAVGTKPEIEVFHEGDMMLANQLVAEGLFAPPPFVQFVLGVRYGSPATAKSLINLLDQLPPGCEWSAIGIGQDAFPMLAQSVLLGGHARIGLEDNLYLRKGELATNGTLVQRAIDIICALGGVPATPSQAKDILGIE